MIGHIVFVSCLLAICLPIICVQLPRVGFVKELHAEFDTETRPTLLRRRRRSPSKKALRRSIRFRSETRTDTLHAQSDRTRAYPDQVTQVIAQGQVHARVVRSIFQGDACVDGGATSREEEKMGEVRASRKPWDLPFRSQPLRIVPGRKSLAGQGHTISNTSPPRKTARDLEAHDGAMRLFPPVPVTETGHMSQLEQCSEASFALSLGRQESLHRQPKQKTQPQARGSRRQLSEIQTTRRWTNSESSPSSFDGSALPSACHVPQPVSPAEKWRTSCYHHRHDRHNADVVSPQPSSRMASTPNSVLHDTPLGSLEVDTKKDAADIGKQTSKAPKMASEPVSSTHYHSFVHWKALLVTIGLSIFIFAFAVLVAHCLAWFLVYRTEARLGEVRSGLLRGGEMKLCLCGKG